jgi:hypothetical protein
VPPILNYGSPELQKRVVPDILNGKKFLALAISEAFAGSDVGGLQVNLYSLYLVLVLIGCRPQQCGMATFGW